MVLKRSEEVMYRVLRVRKSSGSRADFFKYCDADFEYCDADFEIV